MTKKVKWTLEKIKKGFSDFYSKYGHYPTATEIDSYANLPSSRQIQRVYGGLPTLRAKIGLKDGLDLTKGEHSSKRAVLIGKRAHKVELEVYTYLMQRFGKAFIERNFSFSDNKRNNADFRVTCKEGSFLVDTFYPKDRRSMSGCINSKLKTNGKLSGQGIKIFYLMMNEDIGEEYINNYLKRKRGGLRAGQSIMTFNAFKKLYTGETLRRM